MKLLLLLTITVAGWALAAGVAAAVDGPDHWLPSGVAALLCLIPAAGTLLAADWSDKRSPVERIGVILVAPAIRLVFGLVGGVMVAMVVPALKAEPARFLFWGAGLYLLVLVVEAGLLFAGSQPKPTVTVHKGG
jgi:hypothetical protein